MNRITSCLILATFMATPALAELPVCEHDPGDECPLLDVHFINEMLEECQRFREWEDCWFDEPNDIPYWFACDVSVALTRDSCTDTCAWVELRNVETCDELKQVVSEALC